MKLAAAHVPDEMIDELDRIAEARGVERTKVIRWALTEYIARFSLPVSPVDRTIVLSEDQAPADITTT
jgi:predicted transcriptional regulator